jgi:peptidoglycan/LPS O-acetylase OafA/YrhL
MGIVRFLLAAGVVLGHAPGWGGLRGTTYSAGFIMPYHAVQAFFILSGFYMSLTYPKYEGLIWKFYLNRYSRLIFSYWIVAAVAVSLWFIFPDNALSAPYLHTLHNSSGWFGVLVFLSNFLMIGSDSFDYFPQNPNWPIYWAIPQIWSIGTEIWFYLLVPLLVRARTRWLLVLIVAGSFLRFVMWYIGLSFHPWQQKVFFAELPFFLIGILSHRFYVSAATYRIMPTWLGWTAFGAAAVFLSAGNALGLVPVPREESLYNSAFIAVLLFLLIPPIFNLTKKSKIDRFVGEFSYPIYLWHATIGYYFVPAQHLWQGYFLLLLSVLASVPLVVFVERPLEIWRQRSLERATIKRLSQHGTPDTIVAGRRTEP